MTCHGWLNECRKKVSDGDMKRSSFLALLVPSIALAKKPKKLKAMSSPKPTDFDWIWESGQYMAIWVNEDPSGYALLVGPEFPQGLRIMVDGQGDVEFKNRLQFIVESLAN